MAIDKQWNKEFFKTHPRILRIGNVLRLKDLRVENFLPNIDQDIESHGDELRKIREDLFKGTKGKKLLFEEEKKSIDKMKKIRKKSELRQIREAPIVTATCLTASSLPQDIKEKFDLVIIDEAAFAPDWLCLPLILSGVNTFEPNCIPLTGMKMVNQYSKTLLTITVRILLENINIVL